MTKIKKPTFKHIEAILYDYPDIVRDIQRLREDIIHRTSYDENVGGGRSNIPSSPTENTATALVINRKLQHLESIAYAIERVYNTVNDDYKKLIRLKYWTKPQTLTWEGIAIQLCISRRQAFRWRDEIVVAISEVLGWR